MSEPKTKAPKVNKIAPGVLHWQIQDDRIGAESDAYSVTHDGKTVLIDPLPLETGAQLAFGKVEAICLTSGSHQRSAWAYRKQYGAKVYAPEGTTGLEEKPDTSYKVKDSLPGGLRSIPTPGVSKEHHALYLDREGGVLFCGDLLVRHGGELSFLPEKYQEDPKRSLESAAGLLDLRFDVLCLAHGGVITDDPHRAIRKVCDLKNT